MDIESVYGENFLTIGTVKLELDNRGLLLIQGENADDTSADSNGSGKSSILDLICWIPFGTTARDVSGDDVVNDKAKKDCMGIMVINDNGTRYKFERYRKHKAHKNQLFVWQLDDKDPFGAPSIPLHKGTDKETQEVILKIMGCSLDVFVGAIYAGQEKMPDLPGMTDKALKLIVEEAAGVEELAAAYAEARTRSLVADKEKDNAWEKVRMLAIDKSAIETAIDAADTQFKLFEDGRKDRAKAELAHVPLKNAEINNATVELARYSESELADRKTTLEAELASHKTQVTELTRLQGIANGIDRKLASSLANINTEKARIQKQKDALANIDSQVGKPCGECGKAYCEHDLEAAKTAQQTSINAAIANLRTNVEAYRALQTEHAAAVADAERFQRTMTDVSAASAELAIINNQLMEVARLKRTIESARQDIERIKDAARAKLTEPNGWSRVLERDRARLEQCEKDLEVAQKHANEMDERAAVLADCVKVFGPAGVRAHILDTVTPLLNEKTSEYLGALADGNIHATWSTLAKTAKGDLKEKFNIDVTHDKGGKTFKALSGGEKRKVRISAAMALQDMVASRATKPINLFMADEIDHALDEPGLERLMTVLDRKAKERGTVLVVSHNSLSDWIDNVITVRKDGGISTVSGATVRGT